MEETGRGRDEEGCEKRATWMKRNVQMKPICARYPARRQRYFCEFVEIAGINFTLLCRPIQEDYLLIFLFLTSLHFRSIYTLVVLFLLLPLPVLPLFPSFLPFSNSTFLIFYFFSSLSRLFSDKSSFSIPPG